jgi:pimeloyl-ACP methyl ester carboxylesterase
MHYHQLLGVGYSSETIVQRPDDEVVEALGLKVGDHQVHYLKAGDGPPVVLLHGGASDSRDWRGVMAALSPYYSLYAPDMVGYGLTDRRADGYYFSDFVDLAVEFVDVLGLDSPVMVGHSLGGRVCLEVAFRQPDRVAKLVLVNTLGFGRLSRFGMVLSAIAWRWRRIRGHQQPFPKFLMRDGEDYHWICLHQLPAIEAPTLMVWTRHDLYCSLAGAKRAEELLPRSQLEVLPGCGHAPHVERNDEFNRLFLDFLKRNS